MKTTKIALASLLLLGCKIGALETSDFAVIKDTAGKTHNITTMVNERTYRKFVSKKIENLEKRVSALEKKR